MGMYSDKNEMQMIVDVEKNTLLKILIENQKKHVEEFARATQGFKEKMKECVEKDKQQLDLFIEKVQKGLGAKPPVMTHMHLLAPKSFEDSYSDAIGMLELHQGTSLKLDHKSYMKFVKDRWDWKDNFHAVTSTYLG